MNWRVLLLLLMTMAMLSPCKADVSPEEQKLVGQWKHETEEGTVARQWFRANGTCMSELRRGDELIRKFEGLWRLDGDMIVYTHTVDSLAQIPVGTEERDKLIRVAEDYYTIEGGDHLERTYFRVK